VSRKHAALQRKVIRLAGDWKDPHDQESWASRDIVQNIDVKEDGEVKLCQIKGVMFATINVVGVPASERWNRTLNR